MSDLDRALVNLSGYVGLFEALFYAICFVCGAAMVLIGLFRMTQRANMAANATWRGAVATILAGSTIVAFPALVGVLNSTLWGAPEVATSDQIFSYAPTLLDPVDGHAARVVEAIVLLVQFFGLIAVFRGILLLNEHVQAGTPSRLGAGLTFIIAGAVAINLPRFAGLLDELV
ncbi:MAG: hypothetical protein OXE86_20610 [Alphaproteobacteria bacterium]|nr:hypothetical protein [Alphaproteobacteria bacterium]